MVENDQYTAATPSSAGPADIDISNPDFEATLAQLDGVDANTVIIDDVIDNPIA